MFKQIHFQDALDDVTARLPALTPPGISVDAARAPDIPTGFAYQALPILAAAFNDRHWNVATVHDAVLKSVILPAANYCPRR